MVPCGAWYIVGIARSAARRGADRDRLRGEFATDIANQLAKRLQDRLERCLNRSPTRPFYHYQSLYHDPKGASEGASIVPSPLAQGPTDPLIRAYFQIDPAGRVTLPTLPEAESECKSVKVAAQRMVENDLQVAAHNSSALSICNCRRRMLPRRRGLPPAAQQESAYEVMDSDAYRKMRRRSRSMRTSKRQ